MFGSARASQKEGEIVKPVVLRRFPLTHDVTCLIMTWLAMLCGRGGYVKVLSPAVCLEQCYGEHWYLCVQGKIFGIYAAVYWVGFLPF